jgi:hypothetical protein
MLHEHARPVSISRHDHYLRLTCKEILSLHLTLRWVELAELHCLTERTDYFEWSALHMNQPVSVACHYRRLPNGEVLQPDWTDIGCNVMLLDSQGYDAGADLTGCILLELLVGQAEMVQAFGRGREECSPTAAKAC